MAVWIFFLNKHVIVLIGNWRYKLIALLELVPWCVTGNRYGAIATIAAYGNPAKIFQFRFRVHFHVYFHVRFRVRSMSVSMFVSVSVSVSVSVPVSVSVSVSVSKTASVYMSVLFMCPYQLNTALQRYLSDMAIIQLISKACTWWCGNLKGFSLERDGQNQLKISVPPP